MAAITEQEIALLSKYIFSISGIHLEPGKGYLLETRLRPLLREYQCDSFQELHRKAVSHDSSGSLSNAILEAMTTNETFFFRDTIPFDLLRNKIVPELIDSRRGSGGEKVSLRIWSAACSTGQEAYSIAITLREMLSPIDRYDIHILGTDISDQVIAQASYGKYNKFEVERGLSPQLRQKYFTSSGSEWRIKDEIRTMVQFKKMNLMQPFNGLGGKFEIIFCRNVAIYFNHGDKIKLFNKIANTLHPQGSLIVGGSETLSSIAPDFEVQRYLKGVYYQLRGRETEVKVAPPLQPRREIPVPGATQPLPPRQQPKEAIPAQRTKPPQMREGGLLARVEQEAVKRETVMVESVKPQHPPRRTLLSAIEEREREREQSPKAATPVELPQEQMEVKRRSLRERLDEERAKPAAGSLLSSFGTKGGEGGKPLRFGRSREEETEKRGRGSLLAKIAVKQKKEE
ncbi:MAG: protein-glutamate O-methyltransferase CheR [Gammaproteobacteria bacterium]|nr:protein-glutamate O-methyltransferase CheR [Gammaproteobacteria bacterium]